MKLFTRWSGVSPRLILLALLLSSSLLAQGALASSGIPVTMSVDANKVVGELPPIWRFFGADEPNFATVPEGYALLGELGALRRGAVYFRAHNLMTSGDGRPDLKWGSTNLFTEKAGKGIYSWSRVDAIIDAYLAQGIHPYLEIGFMPEALSSAPPQVPYRQIWKQDGENSGSHSGWTYPPRDFSAWAEAVYEWTRHNVQRYGRAEVEKWYFEVWNEADLDFYWTGTRDDFFKLHDYAIEAVRRALPTARVGGPDVADAGNAFMDGFLDHVTRGVNFATGKVGTPLNFLSFHAKGKPRVVDGHVQMDMAHQLNVIDTAFQKIRRSGLGELPVFIGENDPDGCAACVSPQNGYRSGTLFSSYTAALYPRIWELARNRQIDLQGAITWSFTFPGQPLFAGFRQLASQGIDLAIMNVFRLFAKLDAVQVSSHSNHQRSLEDAVAPIARSEADVGSLATRDVEGRTLKVLLWNYFDTDVPCPTAQVTLTVAGAGSNLTSALWRIDKDHGDAFTAWQDMGAPEHLTEEQRHRLRVSSQMKPERISIRNGRVNLYVPCQGVALLDTSLTRKAESYGAK